MSAQAHDLKDFDQKYFLNLKFALALQYFSRFWFGVSQINQPIINKNNTSNFRLQKVSMKKFPPKKYVFCSPTKKLKIMEISMFNPFF